MSRIALKTIGSIPNHKLQKNLQLDGKYISNDGDPEGIYINNQGEVSLNSSSYALQFNGTDEYVSCSDIDAIEGIDNMSVSLWVYFDRYGVTPAGLVTKGRFNTSGSSWAFVVSSHPRISFSVSNSVYSWDGGLLNTEQWYHMVVTYSKTLADIVMYIDGVSIDIALDDVGTFITIPSTGHDVKIGSTSNNEYLQGRVRDVGIWDVALDAAAVAAIYNNGDSLDLSADSGDYDNSGNLVAYYKIDESTGTSLTDSSGNGYTGTATNMDNTNWTDGNPLPGIKAGNDTIQINRDAEMTGNLDVSGGLTIGGTIDSGGGITLDSGGTITLDTAGGNIALKSGGGTYTPTVGSDAATKKYIDANLHAESHTVASHSDTTATGAELETLTDGSDASALHLHDTSKFYYDIRIANYYATVTTSYLPLAGYITEKTSTTSNNEYLGMIAPFNGTLEEVVWRSEMSQNGETSLRILEASDGTEIPGTTTYRKDYILGLTPDDTTVTVDMSSPSVGTDPPTFTKGKLYVVYLRHPHAPYDTNVTLTFKWDVTS